MGQQASALREANLALRAQMEETKDELTRAEENVASLVQAAAESKSRRQDAMVELERMQRTYDTETLISTRRKAEREYVKAEKVVLLDENRFMRGSVKILESWMDSSFTDGYFTASYKVAKAFPHPFNLLTPLGWDRDQIMAKAAVLSDAGPDQKGPLQVASILGPSSLPPATGSGENVEVGSQDPPSVQEKTRPGSSHEIRIVESFVEAGVLRDDPSQVVDEG